MKDKDFTLRAYEHLLKAIVASGYKGISVKDYQSELNKVVMLRQDVDKKPGNSVKTAILQAEHGCKATYYFRVVSDSYDETAIRQISEIGHEIGYHYEDLAMHKGDMAQAWDSFRVNLDRFRTLYPVETITMHGSPLSKWDNRKLWDAYDYKSLGLKCEPYLDIDFSKVFYITDTGGRWNDQKVSRRDFVDQDFDIPIESTFHLAELFGAEALPAQIMQNIHPQRWTDNAAEWHTERVSQGIKNLGKRMLK